MRVEGGRMWESGISCWIQIDLPSRNQIEEALTTRKSRVVVERIFLSVRNNVGTKLFYAKDKGLE